MYYDFHEEIIVPKGLFRYKHGWIDKCTFLWPLDISPTFYYPEIFITINLTVTKITQCKLG